MAVIAPSILAADFARLAEAVAAVERGGARTIHVDAMDGHFVPNLTIGPPVVKALRQATDLHLDCHLMLAQPDRYAGEFAAAGAGTITVHQEACPHLHRSLQAIRALGARAGVALNPATPVSTLVHVLGDVQLVLVMSVNPGFGGQSFLPLAYEKIAELRELRERHGYDYAIEVDGGVGLDNAEALVRAGADILVAGSSVFGTPDPGQAVRELQERAEAGRSVRV